MVEEEEAQSAMSTSADGPCRHRRCYCGSRTQSNPSRPIWMFLMLLLCLPSMGTGSLQQDHVTTTTMTTLSSPERPIPPRLDPTTKSTTPPTGVALSPVRINRRPPLPPPRIRAEDNKEEGNHHAPLPRRNQPPPPEPSAGTAQVGEKPDAIVAATHGDDTRMMGQDDNDDRTQPSTPVVVVSTTASTIVPPPPNYPPKQSTVDARQMSDDQTEARRRRRMQHPPLSPRHPHEQPQKMQDGKEASIDHDDALSQQRQQQQQTQFVVPPPPPPKLSQQEQEHRRKQFLPTTTFRQLHRQQQQQHQMRPPQQQQRPLSLSQPRQPTPHRQREQQTSALGMLWQRVGRGLDDLADLEEAVSGRAKRLLSNVVSTATPNWSERPGASSENKEKGIRRGVTSAASESNKQPIHAAAQRKFSSSFGKRTAPDDMGDADGRHGGGDSGETEKIATVKRTFGDFSLPAATTRDNADGRSSEEDESREKENVEGTYELYKMFRKDTQQPPKVSQKDGATVLEDLMSGKAKMIRANGGASPPPTNAAAAASSPQLRPPAAALDDRGQVARDGKGTTAVSLQATASAAPQREDAGRRQELTKPFAPGYSSVPPGRPQGVQHDGRARRAMPQLSANHGAQQESRQSSAFVQGGDRPRGRPLVDDDEEGSSSLWGRFVRVLPPLPHFPSISKLLGRGSGGSSSLDAWGDEEENEPKGLKGIFRRKRSSSVAESLHSPAFGSKISRTGPSPESSHTPPITDILSRYDHGKSSSLLSDKETRSARSIGHSRAMWDVTCVGFLLLAAREIAPHLLNVPLSLNFADLISISLPKLFHALTLSFDGWVYFALVAAFLCSQSNHVLNDFRMQSMASGIRNTVKSATQHGQLYMRLVSANPIDKTLPDRISSAARSQFLGNVESARLSRFVTLVLSVIILMTVSAVKPVLAVIIDIVMLQQWRHWPLPWGDVGKELKDILLRVGDTLQELVGSELKTVLDHPMQIAFKTTLFASLLAVTVLLAIEQKRSVLTTTAVDGEDEDSGLHVTSSESLSKLGISSASRLGLMSRKGALEASLERWQTSLHESSEEPAINSIRSMMALIRCGLLATVIVALPLLVFRFTGASAVSEPPSGIIRLDSFLDVSILLLFTLNITWKALSYVMESSVARPKAISFLQKLARTVDEFDRSQSSSQMNLQLATSISPTKGIEVRDLWAAHTAKRAWAVRGANLTCRNGEVVLILGDDGSGKTRLLTAISEALVQPPSSALSTTKARGSVSVGGLDASKWDRMNLKRRVGFVLNDVRSVTDYAELFSGLALEEILEPMDAVHNPCEPHTLGKNERSAISLALQISGLSSSLLPKLPLKLSTVVTANEDELKPSPLRPRCSPLSPSEWSKLLFARVLAQTILDNDSTAKSTTGGGMDKCLLGSVLLLDDVLVHMSEVEEARVLKALRRTGAASILTSHKWATGRYADRILVVKDGVIIEQGTHNELLSQGPQRSIYAAKWHALTTGDVV